MSPSLPKRTCPSLKTVLSLCHISLAMLFLQLYEILSSFDLLLSKTQLNSCLIHFSKFAGAHRGPGSGLGPETDET